MVKSPGWEDEIAKAEGQDSGTPPAANAQDEALTELLEELSGSSGVSFDAVAMVRRYWALSANRSKKYRYRAELADQVAHHQQCEQLGHDSLGLAELREQADCALAALAARDQDFLRQIFGYGRSYREIASRLGQPVGTVKARGATMTRR